MDKDEAKRIKRLKKKTIREMKKMMRWQHLAAYHTSLANFYSTLCVTNNWQTIDEVVGEFREQLDNMEEAEE